MKMFSTATFLNLMVIRAKLPLAFILVATALSVYTNAQIPKWHFYSPQDKSFRVEVPKVKVELVRPHQQKWRYTLLEDGVRASLMKVGQDENYRFAVFKLNLGAMPGYQGKLRKDILDYVALMFIGDDDESQYLSVGEKIKNGGFRGTEYTYVNNGASKMFTRARLFVNNRDLFVVEFVGKNAAELTSLEADKFLMSFRIRSKNRRITPRTQRKSLRPRR